MELQAKILDNLTLKQLKSNEIINRHVVLCKSVCR